MTAALALDHAAPIGVALAGCALIFGAGVAVGWTLARRVTGYMLGVGR